MIITTINETELIVREAVVRDFISLEVTLIERLNLALKLVISSIRSIYTVEDESGDS